MHEHEIAFNLKEEEWDIVNSVHDLLFIPDYLDT
jgi:hypothetical protein